MVDIERLLEWIDCPSVLTVGIEVAAAFRQHSQIRRNNLGGYDIIIFERQAAVCKSTRYQEWLCRLVILMVGG